MSIENDTDKYKISRTRNGADCRILLLGDDSVRCVDQNLPCTICPIALAYKADPNIGGIELLDKQMEAKQFAKQRKSSS